MDFFILQNKSLSSKRQKCLIIKNFNIWEYRLPVLSISQQRTLLSQAP